MMSADEARVKTNRVLDTRFEIEMAHASTMIDTASSTGNFQVQLDQDISERAVKRLRELGYKVEKDNTAKHHVIISWNELEVKK